MGQVFVHAVFGFKMQPVIWDSKLSANRQDPSCVSSVTVEIVILCDIFKGILGNLADKMFDSKRTK